MALSFTGLVFGMQQMDVKPPAAAAREPLSMVSACSKPGSRRCTCISMKPGATIMPVASNTSAFGDGEVGRDAGDPAVHNQHVRRRGPCSMPGRSPVRS